MNTRAIKRKIRSVNNIKKITRAMEMVSASKLKKIQGKLMAIRPYSAKLQTIMDNLLTYLPPEAITHPLLKARSSEQLDVPPQRGEARPTKLGGEFPEQRTGRKKNIVAVVMSSDKGLCGGYNANLLKTAGRFVAEQNETDIKIMALGRKSNDYFKKQELEIMASHTQLSTEINFRTVKKMMGPVLASYETRALDEVWLIYSEFVNPMVQKPRVTRFLPMLTAAEIEKRRASASEKEDQPKLDLPYGYLFEPDPKVILDLIVPRYIEVRFYSIVLEAMASEHGARMMAMRNATKNAEEVIDNLTLTFNKARQASITGELLDIVGGAEAMK
ncbi:MAG: ATP synthase F1 subunit gamma [Planctomycetes bacterium]|nr:ATP synthase F1 subunit gamma [Planctomycetota bacterium]